MEGAAIDFVRDAFGHLKAIAVDKGGQVLLQKANIEETWITHRCFWASGDTTESPMTAAAMGDRASPGTATKWTPTPPTSRRS